MYKYWTDSFSADVNINFSKSISLPGTPSTIIVKEDRFSILYQLPDGTNRRSGLMISFNVSGHTLYFGNTISGADDMDMVITIYAWYK